MANTNARGVISFGVAVRGAGALSQALRKAKIVKQQYSGKRTLTIVTKIVGLEKAGKATMRMAKDVAASNTVIGKSSQQATRSVAASVAAINRQGGAVRSAGRVNKRVTRQRMEQDLFRHFLPLRTMFGVEAPPLTKRGGGIQAQLKRAADKIATAPGGPKLRRLIPAHEELEKSFLRPLEGLTRRIVERGEVLTPRDVRQALPRNWKQRLTHIAKSTGAGVSYLNETLNVVGRAISDPTLDNLERAFAGRFAKVKPARKGQQVYGNLLRMSNTMERSRKSKKKPFSSKTRASTRGCTSCTCHWSRPYRCSHNYNYSCSCSCYTRAGRNFWIMGQTSNWSS
jgi:hypothetical protein